VAFRTNRHQVSYLKADAIEAAAKAGTANKTGGDVCYGCHGGRAWYRIAYPYPRNSWPGMPEVCPNGRKASAARFRSTLPHVIGGPDRGSTDHDHETNTLAIHDILNPARRNFLKTTAAGAALATPVGSIELGRQEQGGAGLRLRAVLHGRPVDHCRHQLRAQLRLAPHAGRAQEGRRHRPPVDRRRPLPGRRRLRFRHRAEPQLRACLRGRSYRSRLYSPERLLYPMMRVGERGEGKFKRVSWDEALDHVAKKMIELKQQVRPDRDPRPGLCRHLLRRAAQVGPDRGPAGALPRNVRLPHQLLVGAQLPGHHLLLAHDLRHHRGRQRGRRLRAQKLIIMWGWNPAYTFHGGNTSTTCGWPSSAAASSSWSIRNTRIRRPAYDAWWIPIKPNTDAAMLAGMAHYIFANNLQDQAFIDKFCQGMDAGTMPDWAKGQENFKDYILGTYDNTPKTPEWAARRSAA
jgi:anaerobic dimethyl sulfoxide reductase subunit A